MERMTAEEIKQAARDFRANQEASRKPGTAQLIVAVHDFKSSVALAKFIEMLPNARILWGTTLFFCIEFSQPDPVPTMLNSPKFGGVCDSTQRRYANPHHNRFDLSE